MAAFRFPLQQVLQFRIQEEDQAKVRFARAQGEYLAAERRLREIETQLHEQEAALYNGTLDMMERWLREHFVRGLREDITRTSRMLHELSKLVEQARVELVNKAKDRKILEKFKEKQAQRHAHEEKLKEQREYDEIASIRFKAPSF